MIAQSAVIGVPQGLCLLSVLYTLASFLQNASYINMEDDTQHYLCKMG